MLAFALVVCAMVLWSVSVSAQSAASSGAGTRTAGAGKTGNAKKEEDRNIAANKAGARFPSQKTNGIYPIVKVYDEFAIENLLNAARTNLAQLNAFNQATLISHLGGLQGSSSTQTALGLQGTNPPGTTATAPTPPAAPASYTLPSSFSPSAVDVLNEEMQAANQVINYQLLLGGSLTDQFDPGGESPRRRTTLGFDVNISVPPGYKYQNAVAEVEVSVCAPKYVDEKDSTGPQIMTLLPQSKTYNVASLVSNTASISGGIVAGVVNFGGGFLRGHQTYYLVQAQDTIALERPPRGGCGEGSKWLPKTFAWQFRPVLGQKVVQDGPRQTFAQISFPGPINSFLLCPITVSIRTLWRHYDTKTGRVGEMIDQKAVNEYPPAAPGVYDIPPAPRLVEGEDNGDGTVTVISSGAFRQGTRVRIGGVVQDTTSPIGGTPPNFEQNLRYVRFTASALSVATHDAKLVYVDGTEGELWNLDKPLVFPSCPDRLALPSAATSQPVSQGSPTITEIVPLPGGSLMIIGHNTRFRSPGGKLQVDGRDAANVQILDDTHLTATVNLRSAQKLTVDGLDASEALAVAKVQLPPPSPPVEITPYNDTSSLLKLTQLKPPVPGSLEVVLIGTNVYGLRNAPFYARKDDSITLLLTNDIIRTNRRATWKRLFTTDSQAFDIPFASGDSSQASEKSSVSNFQVSNIQLLSSSGGSGATPVVATSNVILKTGMQAVTGSGLFAVGTGSPTVFSISPAIMQPGESLSAVITGAFTHFGTNSQVQFSDQDIGATPTPGMGDDTHLYMSVTIGANVKKGSYNVTVTTSSETAVGIGVFNVGDAKTLITKIDPPSAETGTTTPVTITAAASTAQFTKDKPKITFSNPNVTAQGDISATSDSVLTAKVKVDGDAAPGKVDVRVSTGTGGNAAVTGATGKFTISPNAPLISSVTPAAGQPGQTLGITITLTAPLVMPALTFSNPGITATPPNQADPSGKIWTAMVNIASTALASASSDGSSSPKATNSYLITGSHLKDLKILAPAGAALGDVNYETAVTFTLPDDAAKNAKVVLLQKDGILITYALPAQSSGSSTPATPTRKAQPAPIAINAPSVPVSGTGMSSVVDVQYQDKPLIFTSSSDSLLTVQLATCPATNILNGCVWPQSGPAPTEIDLVFKYSDNTQARYVVPVQPPTPK